MANLNDIVPENLLSIVIALIGLDFALRYKHHGKSTIESQKRLNKIIPTHSAKDFGEKAVKITQIAYLIGGIAALIIALINLFRKL